jgi:acetolactate synthase I/II/III large subunit
VSATGHARSLADPSAICAAANLLKRGEPTMLLLAGRALRADALEFAGRIASKTGCTIATQFRSARIERGAGRIPTFRIPYRVEPAVAALKHYCHIITVETNEPVSFFSYPGKPSLLKSPDCQILSLCKAGESSMEALQGLADAVGSRPGDAVYQSLTPSALPTGAITPATIALALNALIPDNAIVVDESITMGRELGLTAGARPHDLLQNMGGSVGFGGPVATGAAVARPDRKVICLSGDGSALFTIQCLWTQARENLDVLTVIFANRRYQILQTEFDAVGGGAPGANALGVMSIDRPTIDFVSIAKGLGVPAERVGNAEEFCRAFAKACSEAGPHLLEVTI